MPEAGLPTVETIVRELNAAEKFEKVERRIKKNDTIAGYYEGHADLLMSATGARQPCELPKKDFTLWNACKRSARDMPKCCALWQMDRYPKQRVKDVKKTNSCRNRFCENCQNVLATKRDRKYTPFLEALEKNFDIYAVTVTVPNCERDKLGETISRMFYNFGYINRLFNGNAKIRGMDFSYYGYAGGLRALEITKNDETGMFHPHFHCLFIFRKGLKLDQNRWHKNAYSFNNADVKRSHKKKDPNKPEIRYFSDFEIKLQKIWRLRYDGVKVTQENIKNLSIGYSVVCEYCDPKDKTRFHEAFKYGMKGIFKEGESPLLGQYDFDVLLPALYGRRIIQGYKILNAFDFEETRAVTEAQERKYLFVLAKLQEVEAPEKIYQYLNSIHEEIKGKKTRFISRSKLDELMLEDYGADENEE